MIDKLNSEQSAPADQAWQPDHLAGFRVGDAVTLPNVAVVLEVIGLQPPALLILRAPSGHELRAGWRAVTRIRTRAEQRHHTQRQST